MRYELTDLSEEQVRRILGALHYIVKYGCSDLSAQPYRELISDIHLLGIYCNHDYEIKDGRCWSCEIYVEESTNSGLGSVFDKANK